MTNPFENPEEIEAIANGEKIETPSNSKAEKRDQVLKNTFKEAEKIMQKDDRKRPFSLLIDDKTRDNINFLSRATGQNKSKIITSLIDAYATEVKKESKNNIFVD